MTFQVVGLTAGEVAARKLHIRRLPSEISWVKTLESRHFQDSSEEKISWSDPVAQSPHTLSLSYSPFAPFNDTLSAPMSLYSDRTISAQSH